jgi:hypothetical protein
LSDVFEAQKDFRLGPLEIVGDFAGNEFLLEAFEVEVPRVAEELGAVGFVADLRRVALEDADEFSEGFAVSAWS